MCLFRCAAWPNDFWQWTQMCIFSLVWVTICLFSDPARPNDFSHSEQMFIFTENKHVTYPSLFDIDQGNSAVNTVVFVELTNLNIFFDKMWLNLVDNLLPLSLSQYWTWKMLNFLLRMIRRMYCNDIKEWHQQKTQTSKRYIYLYHSSKETGTGV